MKIPPEWFHLFPGDRIHTTAAVHKLHAALQTMKRQGYEFTTEPSARGHWLECKASPNKSQHVVAP